MPQRPDTSPAPAAAASSHLRKPKLLDIETSPAPAAASSHSSKPKRLDINISPDPTATSSLSAPPKRRARPPPPIADCIDCTCIEQESDFALPPTSSSNGGNIATPVVGGNGGSVAATPVGITAIVVDSPHVVVPATSDTNLDGSLKDDSASTVSSSRRFAPSRASFEISSPPGTPRSKSSRLPLNGVQTLSIPKKSPSPTPAPVSNGHDSKLSIKPDRTTKSIRRHSFSVMRRGGRGGEVKANGNADRKPSLLESIENARDFASRHGSFIDDSFTFDHVANGLPPNAMANVTAAAAAATAKDELWEDSRTPMIGDKEAGYLTAEALEDHERDPNKLYWYDTKKERMTTILTSEYSVKRDDLKPPSTTKYRLYLLFGMFTTTILGIDVATNRYLQNEAGLDGIFIITLRSFAAFIIWAPLLPKFYSQLRTMRFFYLYAFLHSINPPLNTYSVKFTVAYVAQTLKLTSPFFVSGLSYFLKYPVPRFTWLALVLTAIGGFMTIAGDFQGLTVQDAYGSLLSLGNAFVFAVNTLMYSIIKRDVPTHGLTFLENFLQFCVIGAFSFSIDNWTSVWGKMTTETIIVLAFSMLSSMIGAFGRVACARVIGAPLFSAMAPWELVVTLLLSISPFLDDRASVVNIIGIAVVTITLSLYLYTKYLDSEKLRLDALAAQRALYGESTDDEEEPKSDPTDFQGDDTREGENGVGHPHNSKRDPPSFRRKISSFFESPGLPRWKRWGSEPLPAHSDKAYVPLSDTVGATVAGDRGSGRAPQEEI